MKFKEWFNEQHHDLYNFPEEAMEAAWNAALSNQKTFTEQEFELLREAVRFLDTVEGDGTANAPTYKLRGKLAGLSHLMIKEQQ